MMMSPGQVLLMMNGTRCGCDAPSPRRRPGPNLAAFKLDPGLRRDDEQKR